MPYDPRTYGGRFNLAVHAKEMATGQKMTQMDLVEAIQRAVGRTMDDEHLVSQQTISKIQHDKQSECADTPAIAIVLGVAPMWLAYGIGSPSLIDEISRRISQKL